TSWNGENLRTNDLREKQSGARWPKSTPETMTSGKDFPAGLSKTSGKDSPEGLSRQ
ncbi:MAG: hypothetical protein ACI82G_001618, partial [Bradymonadia bacterium]